MSVPSHGQTMPHHAIPSVTGEKGITMTIEKAYTIPENAVVVGLCAGRHDMPVSDFIFPQVVDPTDFRGMSRTVDAFLDTRVGTHISWGPRRNAASMDDEDGVEFICGDRPLVVYVTGLTACVAAVIRSCVYNGVDLTLLHYDRTTGEYIPQVVLG